MTPEKIAEKTAKEICKQFKVSSSLNIEQNTIMECVTEVILAAYRATIKSQVAAPLTRFDKSVDTEYISAEEASQRLFNMRNTIGELHNQLLTYRATQEEDAGKMTFDEWVKRVAAQNPAGLSDIWINAARNGWEAYHQYRASVGEPNMWKVAVIDACVVNHISWDENNPRKSISDLIAYENVIALDPKVSADAQALIDRGRGLGEPRLAVIKCSACDTSYWISLHPSFCPKCGVDHDAVEGKAGLGEGRERKRCNYNPHNMECNRIVESKCIETNTGKEFYCCSEHRNDYANYNERCGREIFVIIPLLPTPPSREKE